MSDQDLSNTVWRTVREPLPSPWRNVRRWRTDRVSAEHWRPSASREGERGTSNGIHERPGVARNAETPNAKLQRADSKVRNRAYATIDLSKVATVRGDWRLLEVIKDPRQGTLVRVRCAGPTCSAGDPARGTERTRSMSVWLSPIGLGWLGCHRCATAARRWAKRDTAPQVKPCTK